VGVSAFAPHIDLLQKQPPRLLEHGTASAAVSRPGHALDTARLRETDRVDEDRAARDIRSDREAVESSHFTSANACDPSASARSSSLGAGARPLRLRAAAAAHADRISASACLRLSVAVRPAPPKQTERIRIARRHTDGITRAVPRLGRTQGRGHRASDLTRTAP
jgi:hypothetical protein